MKVVYRLASLELTDIWRDHTFRQMSFVLEPKVLPDMFTYSGKKIDGANNQDVDLDGL